MQPTHILTPLCAALGLTASLFCLPAQAQNAPSTAQAQQALLSMKTAFAAKDRATLTRLLPNVRGHALEGWGAYWELTARLRDAPRHEVDAFLAQWRGTYYEDRLRNDWLLLLGERRAWSEFSHYLSGYRMHDDPQVQCYSLLIDWVQDKAPADVGAQVRDLWHNQRNADDGCTHAASELSAAGIIKQADLWQRARIGAHHNRPAVVRSAILLAAPDSLPFVNDAIGKPAAFLAHRDTATNPARRALVPLALTRLASSDFSQAAQQLRSQWAAQMDRADQDWVWGSIGRWAAIRRSDDAISHFRQVRDERNLHGEHLEWKVRTALRHGDWAQVSRSIQAMPPAMQQNSTWVYWQARALQAASADANAQLQARNLMQSIAGNSGYYEQLAQHWLGGKVSVIPEPPPLTADEKARARTNPSLQRGIAAIQNGLRSEGVREWNYAINLHIPGGMNDRDLLAAADLACQHQVWDRCINTSERTRTTTSLAQRYPMPFREAVVQRTRSIDLDPAYVYGLIRQESRFIMDARSGVGASGLMQVMPATAKWTANKIGMTDFRPSDINHKETNIAIGTAYLKLALDEFSGSMPLAAAAYNAGPGRPRAWRNGPELEAAIWAENIPFNETRDYVQKVLANATVYSAILTGQPQSLPSRLGQTIGPRQSGEPVAIADLP
ncbi:soluble lytic murein transglycosylase [Lampropedia hyalina DSM 16112]|jgi:soluble lytic murein transglycosylase|uniref:Soluble lytic murein transglycosylase n=1 Tax=Lampropedia hyalina DSM 16112 TaxID=1122156 RepID=A0A1M4XFF0_9BURK|nr:lytic transglycosylase domain-containing protein [Lampropedia hyalina]SHE92036.1 soluble lytic murein transglycosylase [Lampropedia hyalina DSM 16112]